MNSRTTNVFIAALVALFFVGSAIAQQRPILGGYKPEKVDNAQVKDAADFAVTAENKRSEKEIELISIVKAEYQMVQGKNIRMCLKVNIEGAEGQDAAEVSVKAIVNFDLKGNKKLLSWEASDCGESEGGDAIAVGAAPKPHFETIASTMPERV